MEEQSIQKSKKNILDACIDLMLVNGYNAVSVDSICERASVLKGSFYHHFSSKNDLTLQAMDNLYLELKEISNEIFSRNYPPEERLKRFSKCIYNTQFTLHQKLGHVCGDLAITLGTEMACDENIRESATKKISLYTTHFKDTIRDMASLGQISKEVNASNKAHLVNVYFVGKITQARIFNSLKPLKGFDTEINSLIRF